MKKKVIETLLHNGFLIDPTTFETIGLEDQPYLEMLSFAKSTDALYLNVDAMTLLKTKQHTQINFRELERLKTFSEKNKDDKAYLMFLDFIKGEKKEEKKTESLPRDDFEVIFSYDEPMKKKEIQDFVAYFNRRYESLSAILKNRRDLQNTISISRLKNKKEKEMVSVIGMIADKQTTKNQRTILTIEDNTGEIRVLFSHNKQELKEMNDRLVFDEVIGVVGTHSGGVIFANQIFVPDVPLDREIKKHPEEIYAIFLSDLHVGSKNFLGEEFEKFLKWLNGEVGEEHQKDTARKVRYVFIVGDLVDGVGVYPGQEHELDIDDIYEQYAECARLLSKIPRDKTIFICPGNHDAMRIAEPQPPLYKDIAEPIWAIPNVVMLSNPAFVVFAKTKDFPGFETLLYHGYSFDYYVANVNHIRNQGGYDRADLIMKFLLQKRHLAPTHTSTLYIPDIKNDPLVINKIPDFFITGHIHKSYISSYRNIILICGSCWQSKTSFQEKVGHHPEPCRVPLMNLKTREVKILKFTK